MSATGFKESRQPPQKINKCRQIKPTAELLGIDCGEAQVGVTPKYAKTAWKLVKGFANKVLFLLVMRKMLQIYTNPDLFIARFCVSFLPNNLPLLMGS